MNKFFGKQDIIVITSVLIVALTAIFVLSFLSRPGKKVVIYVNNAVYETFSLDEDTKIHIETDYGNNTIVVKNGKVFVEDADCRDKICVNTGEKCNTDDIIVCLPHKLVISVEE